MQESSQENKSKAIEQALASLKLDDISLTPEYLKQYAENQKIELEPTLESTENKGMVMKLTRKEGNNGKQ